MKRILPGLAACLIAMATMCVAQTPILHVRLYSLHAEPRLKFTARTGELQWRLCEKCAPKHGAALLLQTADDQIQINGADGGKQLLIEGDYRIDPDQGLKMNLHAPVSVTVEHGSLKLIANLPVEDYVAAALEGESASFHQPESMKAMAVTIRSYAIYFRRRHKSEGFDLCDNTHCQNLNFAGTTAQVRSAVESTRGELLWYQGSPAATYYHQNCGGTLAAGEEVWPELHAPYLRQHEDTFCRLGAPLPWKAVLDRKQFDQKLREQGLKLPESWTTLEVVSRSHSGRVLKLAFRGGLQPPQFVSASSLRFAIGRSFGWNQVRSDLYEVKANAESVAFSGRGAGHGVGLCQAGAEEMAKQGKSYREILAFYYPGTSLGVTAQGLAWQTQEGTNLQLMTTQPDQAVTLLPVAQGILSDLQAELGWQLDFKPKVKIYPTLDAYRDATGQAGWIAAFTRGQTIALQPADILRKKSVLESTLRHEFAHLLIESRARAGTPLWFREGLVLYLADAKRSFKPDSMPEAEMEAVLQQATSSATAVTGESVTRAYVSARTRVAAMIRQNGLPTVLGWLSSGLPLAGAQLPQH